MDGRKITIINTTNILKLLYLYIFIYTNRDMLILQYISGPKKAVVVAVLSIDNRPSTNKLHHLVQKKKKKKKRCEL